MLIRKLLGGRSTIAVGTKSVILHHATQMGVVDKIKFLEPPISDDPVFMGFSKTRQDAAELAQTFSAELRRFKATQHYQDILQKYGFEPK